MEARQRLRETLGQDMFEKLGFCDMGEEGRERTARVREREREWINLSC